MTAALPWIIFGGLTFIGLLLIFGGLIVGKCRDIEDDEAAANERDHGPLR